MNLWNLRMSLDLKNAWFFTVFWPNLGQITSWYSTCVLEMSQMVFECPFISPECVKMYYGQDLAKKHPITVLVIVFTDMFDKLDPFYQTSNFYQPPSCLPKKKRLFLLILRCKTLFFFKTKNAKINVPNSFFSKWVKVPLYNFGLF